MNFAFHLADHVRAETCNCSACACLVRSVERDVSAKIVGVDHIIRVGDGEGIAIAPHHIVAFKRCEDAGREGVVDGFC